MATKFDRVADDLRARIQAGDLEVGSRLPSETDLLTDLGVSLGTLRRGLDLLAAEGLIDRQQGRGTFVADPRSRIRRHNTRYQWEQDRIPLADHERAATGATEQDTGAQREDLDFTAAYERVRADRDLADAFRCSVGTPLLRRTYATRLESMAPFGLTVSHLRVGDIKANPALLDATNEPWPGGTQHQLFTVGIAIDRIVDHVTARGLTTTEARALDAKPGSPAIALRKVSIDTRDEVVEIADSIWPGDRIELAYVTPLNGVQDPKERP